MTRRNFRAVRPATLASLALLAVLAAPAVVLAGDAAKGKTIYELNCSSCHGPTGKADGPVGQALSPPPRNFAAGEFKFDADKSGKPGEDADLVLVTKNGAMAYGGSPLMAGWPTLSDEDVDHVIAYIRSLAEQAK